MRDVKFRAWGSEKKQMARVSMLGEEEAHLYKVTGETWVSPKHYVAVIMQYTGLKDKNGVEIYEGDIVETQQSDLTSVPHEMVGGIVEWDSKNAMYKIKPLYGSKFHPITMFVRDVVVVGNIYENPELLEREGK